MEATVDETTRHTAAHVLAQAFLRIYPEAKLGIGPVTEEGFYYEFQLDQKIKSEKKLIDKLEAEIYEIIEAELPITQVFLPTQEAVDMLLQRGQVFKAELLQDVEQDEISFYKTGDEFIDLCRGPHLSNTGKLGIIKITKITNSRWKNDETRPEMYRIEGKAFSNEEELENFQKKVEDISLRDHTKLNEKLAIYKKYSLSGLERYALTVTGSEILLSLVEAVKSELREDQYSQIIPPIAEQGLFEQQLIAELARSGSTGKVFSELVSSEPIDSGREGLFEQSNPLEIRAFCLVENKNFANELKLSANLITSFYKGILPEGLSWVYASNFVGGEEALQETGLDVRVRGTTKDEKGYINLDYKDLFGSIISLARIESMPKLAEEINRTNSNNSNKFDLLQVTFCTSLEALMALLLEYYNGSLPNKIAAQQALIIPESTSEVGYAKEVYHNLINNNIRTKIDYTFGNASSTAGIPYLLYLGEQEQNNQVLRVVPNGDESLGLMNINEFLQKVRDLG